MQSVAYYLKREPTTIPLALAPRHSQLPAATVMECRGNLGTIHRRHHLRGKEVCGCQQLDRPVEEVRQYGRAGFTDGTGQGLRIHQHV